MPEGREPSYAESVAASEQFQELADAMLASIRQAIDVEYQRWGDSVSPESQGARQALAHIAAALEVQG